MSTDLLHLAQLVDVHVSEQAPAERLRAAIDARFYSALDDSTTQDAAIAALVDWLAEDENSAYIVGRLWDLALYLTERGMPIYRPENRTDTGPAVYAALDAARRLPWPQEWQKVCAAQSLLGPVARQAEQAPAEPVLSVLQPEPAGFEEEVRIGTVCGEPVYGVTSWDCVAGKADRVGVRCELNGLDVQAFPGDPGDPNDAGPVVNFGEEIEQGGVGDIAWSAWGKMREVAQMPGDPVGQLMKLARRWCSEAAPLAVAAD